MSNGIGWHVLEEQAKAADGCLWVIGKIFLVMALMALGAISLIVYAWLT
jgi:hypothetical protein